MALPSLTIYLVKPQIFDTYSILNDAGRKKFQKGDVTHLSSKQPEREASLYVFKNVPYKPNWIGELEKIFDIPNNFANQSTSAVAFFQIKDRLFLLTFGHARLYLDQSKLVQDFGLKVAMNTIDDERLKKLNIANLSELTKAETQATEHRRFDAFGYDEALELVRKISGIASLTSVEDSEFTISGSNCLQINRATSLNQLDHLAAEFLASYSSTAYKETAFCVVDNISPVVDSEIVRLLDDKLVQTIRTQSEHVELGLPEFSAEEYSSFRFIGLCGRRTFPDLQLSHYRQLLGADLSSLTVEKLKQSNIQVEYMDESKPKKKIPIYRALVGSLVLNESRYAINEGAWYKVDEAFKGSVDSYFRSKVKDLQTDLPPILIRASNDGNKRYLENEFDFNKRYAEQFDYIFMDKQMFPIPEIARSRFELCDVLDVKNKRLIHVKMSGRKSAVLSHFFKQGVNCAQFVKIYPDKWQDIIQRVREKSCDRHAEALRSAIEDRSKAWRVEFHIADVTNINGEYTIPFFSRVTFRDEARRIESMGYEVSIGFFAKPQIPL